jgi:hypothetical protein
MHPVDCGMNYDQYCVHVSEQFGSGITLLTRVLEVLIRISPGTLYCVRLFVVLFFLYSPLFCCVFNDAVTMPTIYC